MQILPLDLLDASLDLLANPDCCSNDFVAIGRSVMWWDLDIGRTYPTQHG